MPAITVRPYAPEDLSATVSIWNRCLTKDPISEDRFWHHFLLDPNFDRDGALVAEIDGCRVGFLQVMVRQHPMPPIGLEPERGWLTVFFVDSERRRLGVGSALLAAGLRYLRDRGRREVWCNGYAPIYIAPGVDVDYTAAQQFLPARQFEPAAEAVAMGMRLEGVCMPPGVKRRRDHLHADGFEIRAFSRADTLPLIAFSERYFPEYGATILDGLSRGNEEIIVATFNGDVAGFTQWQNTYTDPPAGAEGRFGPFGVRPDLRDRGLGSVIFYTLIEHVLARGTRYLWFGWAGGRNLSFYERAGCEVTRRFQLFRRTV